MARETTEIPHRWCWAAGGKGGNGRLLTAQTPEKPARIEKWPHETTVARTKRGITRTERKFSARNDEQSARNGFHPHRRPDTSTEGKIVRTKRLCWRTERWQAAPKIAVMLGHW